MIRVQANASNSGTSITVSIDGGSINDLVVTLCTVSGNPQTGKVKLAYSETGAFEYAYGLWVVSGMTYGSAIAVQEAIAALLVLPGGGSSGGCCPAKYIYVSGTTYSAPTTIFDGQTVVVFTDSSGEVIEVTLPPAASLTAGKSGTFQVQNFDNNLQLIPAGDETLDGQSMGSGAVIGRPYYITNIGNLIPAQTFALNSDGTNFHSAKNY